MTATRGVAAAAGCWAGDDDVIQSLIRDACLEGEKAQIQELARSHGDFLDRFGRLRGEVEAEIRHITAGQWDVDLACAEWQDRCRAILSPAQPNSPVDSPRVHFRLPRSLSPMGKGSTGSASHHRGHDRSSRGGAVDSHVVGGIPELRRFEPSRPLPSRRAAAHSDDPWSHVPVTHSPVRGSPWREEADSGPAKESRRAGQPWASWESSAEGVQRSRPGQPAPGRPEAEPLPRSAVGSYSIRFGDGERRTTVKAPCAGSFHYSQPAPPPPHGASSSPSRGAPPSHAGGAPAASSRSARGMGSTTWRDFVGGSTAHCPTMSPGRPGFSASQGRRPQSSSARPPQPQQPWAAPPPRQPNAGCQRRGAALPTAGGDSPPGEAATLARLEARLQKLRHASREEQRRASKELMVQWHPDKNLERSAEAKRIFQWLQNRRKELGIAQ